LVAGAEMASAGEAVKTINIEIDCQILESLVAKAQFFTKFMLSSVYGFNPE
jgi:hypothetical protein